MERERFDLMKRRICSDVDRTILVRAKLYLFNKPPSIIRSYFAAARVDSS